MKFNNTLGLFLLRKKRWHLAFTILLLSVYNISKAQTITVGTGTLTDTHCPIYSYYGYNYSQTIYLAGELTAAGATGPSFITSISYYYNTPSVPESTWDHWDIYMKNSAKSLFATNSDWDSGLSQVFSGTINIPATGGQWITINLDTPFLWDGTSNLIVGVNENSPGYSGSPGAEFQVTTLGSSTDFRTLLYYEDPNNPNPLAPPTANYSINSFANAMFDLTPAALCSGSPASGIAISSNSLVCANTSFALSLTNGTLASGLMYQWQSSANGSTWNNLGSAQASANYAIANITDTTYYRCITTCTASALSSTSTPVVVNLNPLVNCYCIPSYSLDCTSGDKIMDFSIANVIFQPTNCDFNGFSDSTSSAFTVVNLNAGSTYSLQANIANSGVAGAMAAGAWIDYNQNAVFESNEFINLGYGGTQIYSNTFSVPLTAPSGSVRMRLKVDANFASSFTLLDPCNNNNSSLYGQIIDYKVNITAAPVCSGAPNAGNATSTETAVCQNKSFVLDLTGNSIASSIAYQWQSSTDNVIWNNMGASQNTIPYSISSQSVTTHYRCVSTCSISALSATSTPVTVNQNLPTTCYCTPSANNCGTSQITNVLFETVNDIPLCNVGGYSDNTVSVSTISLTANQTYTITTTINTQGETGYVGCWIDFNQDGIFDNNEYTDLGNTSSTFTLTNNIDIPFTAVGGNTRMRLKMESTWGTFSGLDACMSSQYYGQTIDYAIYITPSTPCSGTPNAGDVNSTVSSICENSPFTLDLTNNDISSNMSYQWQSSTDNIAWTNLSSPQTFVPYTVASQSVTSYYRCLVTCTTSAMTATATTWTVTQNAVTACYCIPEPTDCNGGDEINYVAFATMTNTSACDGTDGYSDYTGSVTSPTVGAGQSYTLTTRLGNMFGEHVYVWIDYNQNGIFDSSEFSDLGFNSGNDTIQGPINISINALPGNTRMRVRNYSGWTLSGSDACISPNTGSAYGETEDYNITILPPDCSIINFPPSIALSGNFDICPGGSTVLDLSTPLQAATGITYQWKYFNGTAYVNAGTASATSSFTDTPTSNTPYFCEILCNGNPVKNSDTVYVKVQTITTSPVTTSITCNGACNGSATMNASSFGATLTYSWSPSSVTTDIGTGLCAGIYTINISNPTGCIVTETISITEPVAIAAIPSQTNVSCFGLSDAVATVTVTGGVSPLNFSWLPAGGTGLTASNLAAGNYTFTISDGNGCTLNQTVTVTEPSQLSVSVTNTIGTCVGGTAGQAEMIVSGGTPSYYYSWTSGGIGQLETGLPIGTQTCTITDANSCSITETVSITSVASNFSLSISGVSSICEQLEDSVTSNITGGSGSFSYAWLELPTNATSTNPNFTYTASVGTYSYNLTVTDNVSNCVVNSNSLALVVNPSSNFSGNVTTFGSVPVAGRVVLYKYLPFYTKFDSVAGQNIGAAGDFLFTSFTSGTYIIKAIPTATNMQIAYGAAPGDTAVAWKDANQINHGCAVNDVQDIFVKPLTVLTNTTTIFGSLSGGVYGDPSYGQRPGDFGAKPTVPGTPIGGIIVKGGKNPGGQMFVQTITDPTTGTYTLQGLPPNGTGESYFILVDIPGLDTNNTYHRVINISNNNYQGLDFLVDSAKITPVPENVISVHDISAIENQVKVYPNPASNNLTIQYNLQNNSLVKIELFDMLGKSVKLLLPETQQSMEFHKKSWQIDDMSAGLYFIKMTINGSESTIKLSVTN